MKNLFFGGKQDEDVLFVICDINRHECLKADRKKYCRKQRRERNTYGKRRVFTENETKQGQTTSVQSLLVFQIGN